MIISESFFLFLQPGTPIHRNKMEENWGQCVFTDINWGKSKRECTVMATKNCCFVQHLICKAFLPFINLCLQTLSFNEITVIRNPYRQCWDVLCGSCFVNSAIPIHFWLNNSCYPQAVPRTEIKSEGSILSRQFDECS